jgi:uncharacterized protein (TIGR03067 family)
MVAAMGGMASADEPDARAKEREAFRGSWALIYAETDGKPADAEAIAGVVVTFDGETHSVRKGDHVFHNGMPFTIDAAASPKAVEDQIGGGKVIRGIYRIEGDTLLSCVGAVDAERPEAFGTKEGSGRTLRIFRRLRGEGDAKARAIADEEKAFEGTWVFESLEIGGKALPAELLKGSTMLCEADRFTMTDGLATHAGRFVVDPAASPKTIDVIFTEGPNRGHIARGVYTLEGDTYTIAVGMAGAARPSKVEGGPGGHAFEVLKRKAD